METRMQKLRQWLRNNRGFLVFLVGLGLFRTAVADWNPIPSGSMRPTILEGDVVFVDRIAYDLKLPLTDIALAHLGDPRRGDIVTFHSPQGGTRLIKRIVALPGDVVEVRDEKLLINGQAASYTAPTYAVEKVGPGVEVEAVRDVETFAGNSHQVQFLSLANLPHAFGPVRVPAGQYFAMGDNRDNSEDSRYIGFIPRELLIGRATRIVVSADITGNWLPRFERTASALH